MDDVRGPDEPGYKDDIYAELNTRLQEKRFGESSSQGVEQCETCNEKKRRKGRHPGLRIPSMSPKPTRNK